MLFLSFQVASLYEIFDPLFKSRLIVIVSSLIIEHNNGRVLSKIKSFLYVFLIMTFTHAPSSNMGILDSEILKLWLESLTPEAWSVIEKYYPWKSWIYVICWGIDYVFVVCFDIYIQRKQGLINIRWYLIPDLNWKLLYICLLRLHYYQRKSW